MNFAKGSEWRKWDLHVHSPLTHLNNNFSCNLKEYAEQLKASDISVFGITNYFCFADEEIEGLRGLLHGTGKVILPNLEFRIQQPNKDGEFINIHLIFKETINISELNKTLNRIELINTNDGKPTYCNKEDILRVGIKNVIVDYKNLLQKIRTDFEPLKDFLIIGCPRGYGSFRPAPNSPNEGRGHALAKEIDIMCHGFFGKMAERKFFSNENRFEGAYSKPVFQASDAHKIEDLGNEFSWIKADITFEGLKQTIFEPECRVELVAENPSSIKPKIRINSIGLTNGNGFPIKDQKIEFNSDLVCIIGGRGSGKSAILETLAYCFDKHFSFRYDGSKRHNGKYNYQLGFIDYNIRENKSVDIEIEYYDKNNKPLDTYKTSLHARSEICNFPFLYLGQNQIESFALDNDQLHQLVFNTIKSFSSNVSELDQVKTEIEKLEEELATLNLEIQTERQVYQRINLKALWNQLSSVAKELELLTSESNRSLLDKLSQKRVLKDKYETTLSILENISTKVENTKTDVYKLQGSLKLLLKEIGVSDDINFDFSLLEQTALFAKERITALNIISEYEQALFETKGLLQGKIDVSIEYIEGLKTQKQSIEKKLLEASEVENRLKDRVQRRYNKLNQIFEKTSHYNSLYNKSIQQFTAEHNEVLDAIRISAVVEFDYLGLVHKLFDDYVDKRKVKTFDQFANEYFSDLNKSGLNFSDWIQVFLSTPSSFNIFYEGMSDKIESIIFSNYWSINSNLEYKITDAIYKPLSQLSLGQKGTVLLKIFLSTGSNCPIIIDQPEDHLDNDFIYSDLVKTIRKAKIKRQVIVVTHDANLVVNGDAEQVIVASYNEGSIMHGVRGSLENSIVREKVAKILEGGDVAFKKRELKYQFRKTFA